MTGLEQVPVQGPQVGQVVPAADRAFGELQRSRPHQLRLGGRQFRRGPCMHPVPQDLPERVEVGVQQGAGLLPKILRVGQLGQATP